MDQLERNKQAVRDSIKYIWNQGALDRLSEFYTEDFISHQGDENVWEWPPGHEGLRLQVTEGQLAFPDYTETIEHIIAEDDYVSVRQWVTGTNTGPGPFPPTGKKMRILDTFICRLEDGRLAEQWGLLDHYAMLVQLGLSKPVGEAVQE